MRIYLIGAGAISRAHANAVNKLFPGKEAAVHVADPSESALNSFLEQYPEAIGYADAQTMLAQPANDDDIVVVGTPPFTHFKLAELALKSGRHVLCEKPMVMNDTEADELVQLSKSLNRLLGCCSSRFLGLAKNEEVKRAVQTGEIGDPYHVTFVQRSQRARAGIEYQPQSRWFIDRSKSGGGCLMDWGSYDFGLLNDIFQPVQIEVLGAWTKQIRTETDPQDVVFDVETHFGAMLKLECQSGNVVHIQYERSSCTHGHDASRMEIEGTAGALEWSPYGGDVIIKRSDREGKVNVQEQPYPEKSQFHIMDNPLRYFIDAVNGEAHRALLNEQSAFNFRCITAIYEAAQTGRKQSIRREVIQ